MLEQQARFAPEFSSVSEARRFVRRILAGWGLEGIEDEASLLVTELATNSVLHARTEFEVTLAFDGKSLRLGVSDDSPRVPEPKSHSRQATTGRGLSLVAAVADSWGVEQRPGGKTIWCALAFRSSERAAETASGEASSRLASGRRSSSGSGPPTGGTGHQGAARGQAAVGSA